MTAFLKRKHAAFGYKIRLCLPQFVAGKILFIIRKLQSSENAVTDRLAAKAINVKQLT